MNERMLADWQKPTIQAQDTTLIPPLDSSTRHQPSGLTVITVVPFQASGLTKMKKSLYS